jgi:predicted DsbA family dithiol-disulfide isomerase
MKLEIFFDYTCPFCLRGHEYLLEVLPEFPEVQVVWRPCEAHPRPERHGPHSDLCARGLYVARELGADLAEYNRRMYQAAQAGRLNIEDAHALAGLMDGLLDPAAFSEALRAGAYEAELAANNRATWEEHGFDAVPSLALNGRKLPAEPGLGLRKDSIRDFLEAAGA